MPTVMPSEELTDWHHGVHFNVNLMAWQLSPGQLRAKKRFTHFTQASVTLSAIGCTGRSLTMPIMPLSSQAAGDGEEGCQL